MSCVNHTAVQRTMMRTHRVRATQIRHTHKREREKERER